MSEATARLSADLADVVEECERLRERAVLAESAAADKDSIIRGLRRQLRDHESHIQRKG